MSLLRNTKPLVVDPLLAEMIGLNEALVLQQVNYWLEINRKKGINECDGRTWTYNTLSDWHSEFSFWSKDTVKRTLNNLRACGLLITGNYNKRPGDRTLWYSIDFVKLEEYEKMFKDDSDFFKDYLSNILRPKVQNALKGKMPQPKGQNAPENQGQKCKMPSALPETSFAENSPEICSIVDLAITDERFTYWWRKYCEGLPDDIHRRESSLRLLNEICEKYQLSTDQLIYAVRECVKRGHAGSDKYVGGILANIGAKRYPDVSEPLWLQVENVVKARMRSHDCYVDHYNIFHESKEVHYQLQPDTQDDYIKNIFQMIEIDVQRQCRVKYRFHEKMAPKQIAQGGTA